MRKVFRWAEALGSLLLLLWFVLPVAAGPQGEPLNGVALISLLASGPQWAAESLLLLSVWLVPVFVLFRLVSLLFPLTWIDASNPLGWSASLSRFVAASAFLSGTVVSFSLWGNSNAWFAAVPLTAWGTLLVGAVFHILSVVGVIHRLNYRNPAYAQYREFVRVGRDRVVPGSEASRVLSAIDRLLQIRAKMLLAFVTLIVIILLVLSTTLLSNYERTILKAVGDGARAQVEQATSVYKANLGGGTANDESRAAIAMFDFLNAQTRINTKAAFPFRTFTFYTDLKSQFLLDAPKGKPFPPLKVEYSSLFKDERFPKIPALASQEVQAILTTAAGSGLHSAETATYLFAAPILKNEFEKTADGTKIRHDLLLGLAVITFDDAVIQAPYIQTRTLVILLTVVFLYLAVILVYLVGNFIVNPLLFLRMNVRSVSDALQTMIRGSSRVSAANLRFDETVHSRDEVRSLSGEIGNMVTVIKGIIPYISASTLKQAEQGTALSQAKHLAFLFTDIRGFTTLCEGMEPSEVVSMLNRYLDLETEIILANHGDVDKFVGDEMMAFFDGPQKELNACRAAMQIRKAMYEEKALRQKQGLPAVEIGIGINSGDVVFGSVGARDRMDFTSIGDTVNLAARLEGANKAYASKSIIAESVYERVKQDFLCRELDFIAVKGKNEPVRIFEILQVRETAAPKLFELAKSFEKALGDYRTKRWTEATATFKTLVEQYQDGPSEIFLERIRRFEKIPPAGNWDGVFRMETK